MDYLVGPDGGLPLPWLQPPLAAALQGHRGHALLMHGSPGVGAMAFAFTLAQAWLCEAGATGDTGVPAATRPCGRCGSCRLVQGRAHPDLTVLMPETLRRQHEWPLPDDKSESERKPSRQIRIDDVRHLIERVQRTSARGRGKVALVHPADAVNLQAANALLKTLEEPPAGTRLLLTTADPALLLPTVRSRCQLQRLLPPPAPEAAAWLAAQASCTVEDAQVLLAGCSGRPLDAAELMRDGVDARAWSALPAAVAAGQAGTLSGWPVPRAVDALQKLCHDALARACGGPARYFPSDRVPAGASPRRLSAWANELARVARHDEHPWNEGLLIEALVAAGATALVRESPRRGGAAARSFDTLGP